MKKEQGISNVFGVIVLVLITALLASTISIAIFGIAEDTPEMAIAHIEFTENEGEYVDITLKSVQHADHIYVQPMYGKLPTNNNPFLESGGVMPEGYSEGPSYTENSTTQHYLLSGDNGGVGTTIRMNTTTAEDGTITIIGVVNGKESIIREWDYSGGRNRSNYE